MTPERLAKLRTVLARRQPDLTVITDEVHKGRNLSAIIRSCDAVGIGNIHIAIPERGFRAFNGTAMGSQKWVESSFYESTEEPIKQLQDKGYQVVAAHVSASAKPFYDVDYTKPTALLLGTEKEGVSEQALDLVDQHITIPMQGMVESYNVSAACSIILVEAQRQRLLADMYSKQRLDQKTFDRLFFEWAHPVITQYCKDKNIDYPELDEDGEIIDPAKWYHSVKELPKVDEKEL